MRIHDPLYSRRSVYDDFNILTGNFESFDYSNPKISHGKGSGTNTVTSNSAPPPQIMAAYQQALSGAQTASSAPLQQYQNPTVAGFTPDQTSAFNTIDQSQGIANPFINSASQLINQGTQPLWSNVQQFSPNAVQQYMSPYTQNVLNTTMASEQNQDQQQQAALQGNAISSGAWGGDRAGVASAILSGQQALANNQTNAGIENQGYTQGLSEFNTQQQAQLGANEANQYLAQQGAFGMGNLGNEAQSTALSGANAQEASGALQQQLGQEALNVPYQNYLQQQAYPFQTAQYYANIAEGLGGSSGGTSSTTSPGASTFSQLGGLGIGGLGLAGSLGAFSGGTAGAGALGSAAGALWPVTLAAKHGGRIGKYDSGGSVGIPTDIPDLSVSFVPQTSMGHSGMGIPRAPQPAKTQDPMQQGMQFANEANSVGKILNGQTQTLPGFDDGGSVGGMSPLSAQTQGIQQPTAAARYNNMTPQQLQNYLMRLPPGSQQSQQIQQVLQQKKMMPNVGTPAQGGFGSQQTAQPQTGMARGGVPKGYADGSDIPDPPTPDQIAVQQDVGDDIANEDSQGMAPPVGVGAMGSMPAPPPAANMQPVASSKPPGDDTPPHVEHESVNPWLSLAAAGFASAAGNSPHALQNFGAGALTELQDYTNQKKQVDNVNEAADKLLVEAKQHRDQLAIEQQNADTNKMNAGTTAQYRQDAVAQQKADLDQRKIYEGAQIANMAAERQAPKSDGMGGWIIPNPQDPTKPGRIAGPFGDMSGSDGSGVSLANAYNPPKGSDGKPLTGDAYLATLPPAVASKVKQFGDLEQPTSPYLAARGDPVTKTAMNAVPYYKPGWTAADYGNLQKWIFNSNDGAKAQSITRVADHTTMLRDLIDAMDTGDQHTVNAVNNKFQTEFGLSSPPANLAAATQLVGNEIANASISNGGKGSALGDREEISKNFDPALSKDILKSNLDKVYLPAIQAQVNSNRQSLKAAVPSLGDDVYDTRFLTPNAREKFGVAASKKAPVSDNAPPVISSPDDPAFKALPSGATFMTQDGRTLVKH